MNNLIELYIDDQIIYDFTSIKVDLSMETIANAFSFNFAGKIPEISDDAEIKIKHNGQTILTGYVEAPTRSESGNSGIGSSFSGRSRSGQLIGPSILGASEYKNKTVLFIVEDLCKPFGIKVKSNVPTGDKIKKFSIKTSEDPYSAIIRLLKLRKIMARDDFEGNLVLDNSVPLNAEQTITKQFFNASSQTNRSNVFSQYQIIGYAPKNKGEKRVKVKSDIIENPEMTRYRPFKKISDTQLDKNTANKMAQWELQTRNGKSRTVTISGVGWRQVPEGKEDKKDNPLWFPNMLVPTSLNALKINENQLISNVSLEYSNSGEKVSMTLINPGTYL